MEHESKTAEPSCRQKLIALGLPYGKSGCSKCGSTLREGWRCAEEVAADDRAAASKAAFLEGFRAEVARCEDLLDEARGRLAAAENFLANGFPVAGGAR